MLDILFLSVSNLQVSGVTFPTVNTTMLKVSWTAPNAFKSFIDYYGVEWKEDVNNVGLTIPQIANTFTTISPLTPGMRYFIYVKSVNTRTDSSNRVTEVSTEQSTSKLFVI